jgi:hypothetical protein
MLEGGFLLFQFSDKSASPAYALSIYKVFSVTATALSVDHLERRDRDRGGL